MKPCGIALVLCDAIYTEPGGKTALVGLFSAIKAARIPAVHPRMCVYVSVTDIKPSTTFKLSVEHAESGRHVAELKGPPPKGINPTAICDFRFTMDGLTLPEAGRYFVQFWGNDDLIMQRPFDLIVGQRPKQKKEGKL